MSLDHLFNNQQLLLNNKSPKDIIQHTRNLITPRTAYVPDKMALDSEGNQVKPKSTLAVRWNIEGALARSSNSWGIIPPGIVKFLDSLVSEYVVYQNLNIDPDYFATFGDFGQFVSHDCMLGFLDYALQKLEDARD